MLRAGPAGVKCGRTQQRRSALGENGDMRPAWWAGIHTCILLGAVTCAAVTSAATYQFLNQPSLPSPSPAVADGFGKRSLDRSSARPMVARLQDVDDALADLKAAPSPIPADREHHDDDAASPGLGESPAPDEPKQDLSYLAYYAYSELPPETKPAETVLDSLKTTPPGTPVEEIKRVADRLGLDFTFLKAVARIESGFNPNARTGSYIGLFQMSLHEFRKYGSGDIRNPRDNAVAAALKMTTEAILFEMFTHKKPTLDDMYLIHQQGIEGAAEHVSHPNRLAWRSMCATEEGKEKGEKWCKRAIWGNTLPAIKKVWKNVNKVTSAAFVGMWQQRVAHFYAKYSETAAAN
jgi:hypothetical protein